jgi:hypothetical protein
LLVFAVAGGMSLLVVSAQGADDKLPPEVRVLIGMKLPAVRIEGTDIKRAPWAKPLSSDYVRMSPARVPGFIYAGGALVYENDKSINWLAYSEVLADGKWPVFIIERIYEDKSTEILDAQMLPAKLLEWPYVDKQLKHYLEDRFRFSESCRTGSEDNRIIFGLVKPERDKFDCGHFSRRVKIAWLIDPQTGRIKPISTQGLQCYFLTMSEC